MLHVILCYNEDRDVFAWSKEKDDAVMASLGVVHDRLEAKGVLGPSLRLDSVKTARTYRKTPAGVTDGPFAETKEQLLGFYIIDCASLDAAIETAKELAAANPGTGSYEIRPVAELNDSRLAIERKPAA